MQQRFSNGARLFASELREDGRTHILVHLRSDDARWRRVRVVVVLISITRLQQSLREVS